jgi:hypothetical protein
MMTAEERARAALLAMQMLGGPDLRDSIGSEMAVLTAALTASIFNAVAAERERCAIIAEIAATHALGDPCRIIAQRIRIDPLKGE